MSASLNFFRRLRLVTVPTVGQVLGSVTLSLLLLVLAQSHSLLQRLGITSSAINVTSDQFHDRFGAILRSPIASHLALVTFWAIVGLIAYLVCWGGYNILIEARNEVTLSTTYTNRGHWRGPYETLALKAAAAVGLAIIIGSLWYGLSFWFALSSQVTLQPTSNNIVAAILSVLGLAAQLYLALMFIQLTFTPWYRSETFTDV